jgi:ABC-type transport system involved in cytochrome bd biosynthesis fused ATPase/permease subunit
MQSYNTSAHASIVIDTLFLVAYPSTMFNSIQNLLTQPDVDTKLRDTAKSTDAVPLSITNGTFQWADTPTLKDVTIQVRRGQLTALVGAVGSGNPL